MEDVEADAARVVPLDQKRVLNQEQEESERQHERRRPQSRLQQCLRFAAELRLAALDERDPACAQSESESAEPDCGELKFDGRPLSPDGASSVWSFGEIWMGIFMARQRLVWLSLVHMANETTGGYLAAHVCRSARERRVLAAGGPPQ